MDIHQRIDRGFHRIGIVVATIVFLVVVVWLWGDMSHGVDVRSSVEGASFRYVYLETFGSLFGLAGVISFLAYCIVRVIGGVIGWVVGGFSSTDDDY